MDNTSPDTQMDFLLQLMHTLQTNAYNFYIDNFDIDRPRDRKNWLQLIVLLIQKKLTVVVKKPKFVFLASPKRSDLAVLDSYLPYLPDIARLYALLGNEQSRKLLVSLFAYKILGKERVRLPLANKNYGKVRKSLRSLETGKEQIFVKSMNIQLVQHDLKPLGYDLKIFAPRGGVHVAYVSKQYEYLDSNPPFKIQPGDTVIDAGAGFGDTAFRFAYETGKLGKVYSFEFVPTNIEIFRRTMLLNPSVSDRIEIVERPVWSLSNMQVGWQDGGASTRIHDDSNAHGQFVAQTISIDDWVDERNIEAVHLIKMDIEGAELEALKGSVRTLKRFKPKLAIALYHKLEDFWTIPDFIQSLDLGYRFYLGHYTIFEYETVLYAIV